MDTEIEVAAPADTTPAAPATEVSAPAPEPTMEDTMRARLAELQAEDGGEGAEAAPDAPEGRMRGPDGRFLPRGQQAEQAQVEGEPDLSTRGPPSSLTVAAKGMWETLPPEIKAEFHKREQDFHRGIEQYRAKSQAADTLASAIMPYQNLFQATGVDVPTGLRELLGAASRLQMGTPQQKAQTLREIANTFGVDMGQEPTQQFVDPEVAELRARVYAQEQRDAQRNAMALQQEHSVASNILNEFSADPANKYFEDVRHTMGLLIQAGTARTLPEAYDMACHANPAVREALAAETRAKEQRAAAEAAAKAKRLGSQSVRGTPTPGQVATPARAMFEDLHDVYRQLNAR